MAEGRQSAMLINMRLLAALMCLGMLGCFRTIDTGSGGGPPTPLPPRRPFMPDAGFDSGPFFFDSSVPDSSWFPDSSPPDSSSFPDATTFPDVVPPDASFCAMCELDSECPQPPPVGCGRAFCAAGLCTIGVGVGGLTCSAPAETCDPRTLECVVGAAELNISVLTDFERFVEFDRLVIEVERRTVLEDTELGGNPAMQRIDSPPFLLPAESEHSLSVALYLGCAEIDRRSISVTTGPTGTRASSTLVFTR